MLTRVHHARHHVWAALATAMVVGLLWGAPLAAQTVRQKLPDETQLARAGLIRQWFSVASLDPLRNQVGAISLDDGTLYAQTTNGTIAALDGETGRRLWVAQVGSTGDDLIPITTNDSSLFVLTATDLYVLDKATGSQRWQTTLQHTPSAAATATETELYIPMFDGTLDVYDLQKQRRSWYYATGSRLLSHPIFALGNVAFASNNGNLYVTHRDRRVLVFRYETDAPISAPLVNLDNEWIILASEDFNVYCVHAANGRTRWRFSAEAPILNEPEVVGNKIFILPETRGMFQLDAETGHEDWRSPHPTRFISASPTRIYGTDRLGNLVVLDRNTGKLLAAVDTIGFEIAATNTQNDRIYLASRSGLLVCLREMGLEEPAPVAPLESEPPLPDGDDDVSEP